MDNKQIEKEIKGLRQDIDAIKSILSINVYPAMKEEITVKNSMDLESEESFDVRLVAYISQRHKDFIQELASMKGMTESRIVRYIIDSFIQSR